jgi:hypothetical protein
MLEKIDDVVSFARVLAAPGRPISSKPEDIKGGELTIILGRWRRHFLSVLVQGTCSTGITNGRNGPFQLLRGEAISGRIKERAGECFELPDCPPASSNAQYCLESIGVAAVGDDVVARAVAAKRGHLAHQDMGFGE